MAKQIMVHGTRILDNTIPTKKIQSLDKFIENLLEKSLIEQRIITLEAVQRMKITRTEGDNLLSMLGSGNHFDVQLALELINNLGK